MKNSLLTLSDMGVLSQYDENHINAKVLIEIHEKSSFVCQSEDLTPYLLCR